MKGALGWIGALAALSLPSHLYSVWDDYPAWYHFLYLGYLVPVAGFTGRQLASRSNGLLRADLA